MAIKSVLKPEGSLVLGAAVIGLVYATYQGGLGSVATAHATDVANNSLTSSKKKAGYTALAIVAGLAVIARDANVVILGGAAIIVEELCYTHAIHSNPVTGALQMPPGSAYEPAQNVVPLTSQGQAVGY